MRPLGFNIMCTGASQLTKTFLLFTARTMPSAHGFKQKWMVGIANVFAHVCVLAGAGRIVGISKVFARVSAPGHRSGRVVMAQTRNTNGGSNNPGVHASRTSTYMLESPNGFA